MSKLEIALNMISFTITESQLNMVYANQ